MTPSRKRLLIAGLISLPISAVLAGLLLWQSLNALAADLKTALDKQLPQAILNASVNLYDYHRLNELMSQRINADLAALDVDKRVSPVNNCRAVVLRLRDSAYPAPDTISRRVQLGWQFGDQQESLTLGLGCQTNWFIALALPFTTVYLAVFLAMQLVPPLPPRQRQLYDLLRARGLAPSLALNLSRQLRHRAETPLAVMTDILKDPLIDPLEAIAAVSERHIDSPLKQSWLRLALHRQPGALQQALDIAEAPPQLEFQPDTLQLSIHGLALKLPATPYFYYLWYARQRLEQHEEGWFVNPPSNRPDHLSGQKLAALMEAHGGHPKAINDLQGKGLRAKTLDQNRSKIKDELVSILGEQLAAPYLFDMERDHKTARSKYRLATAPENLRITG